MTPLLPRDPGLFCEASEEQDAVTVEQVAVALNIFTKKRRMGAA